MKLEDLRENEQALTNALSGWDTEESSIWVTNNPYSGTLSRVRDLIRYPYGCVEQTSTSLRPLLTANQFSSRSIN